MPDAPLYTSPCAARSLWHEYRVHTDRVELDTLTNTMVVPFDQIEGVHVAASYNQEVSAMTEDIRAQFFPMSLPAGVIGQSVDRTMATVATEIQALNAQIFRPAELRLFHVPPERQPGMHRLQQSYTRSYPECVVFYAETHRPVGWFYSYREDAATAFIDMVGFLPAYRGQGLYTAFLPKYLAYIAALGYERVTTPRITRIIGRS